MESVNPRPNSILTNHRKMAVENLKRCPLCDTVNAKLNAECFVCRWAGDFDTNPDSIEIGLLDVLDHCPELIDSILHMPTPPATKLERAKSWLRRTFGCPLDLRA